MSRPSTKRRCCAYAVLAKTDVATTPGIPGYATIGLRQGCRAGTYAAQRGREGRASARPVAHRPLGPAREVPAPPSARGVRTVVAVYGRDAFRRVPPGTPMLRMRLRSPAWAGGSRFCATEDRGGVRVPDAMSASIPNIAFCAFCAFYAFKRFDWTGGGLRGRIVKNFGNLCIPFRICVRRKAL